MRAIIVSEAQAQEILVAEENSQTLEGTNGSIQHGFEQQSSGEILNSTSTMEFNGSSGVLSANFRSMSLKRIKRSDRRAGTVYHILNFTILNFTILADTVTEEKFTILFVAEFHVGTNELVFYVRTLSLPIVVIVHGNQEANAAASILWDNAFSENHRIPFKVPDQVKWFELIQTLNLKWKHELNCKFGLSDRAITFLGQKIFRGSNFNDKSIITWSMFNRESLPGRNFTFWQWFESVMSLMKNKLCIKHWNDHAIVGFISKQECESVLGREKSGTFMMRFSDSELGGLTVGLYFGHYQ